MSSLLLGLILAAAGDYGVALDLRGSPAALGARTSFSRGDALELSVAGSRSLSGLAPEWGYQVGGTVAHRLGRSIKIGARAGVGTTFDASLLTDWSDGKNRLTFDVGYQRTASLAGADTQLPLILGEGLVANARLEAPLGPVVPYVTARFGRSFGSSSSANPALVGQTPKTAAAGGGEHPTDASGGSACGPLGIWPGLPESSESTIQQVLLPGAGLAVPLGDLGRAFAQAEYAPSAGALVFAGISVKFDALVQREPAPIAPVTAVRGEVEIALTSDRKPLVGTVTFTGLREHEVQTDQAGRAKLSLEPGTWRAVFRAPGHLAQEASATVIAQAPVFLEAELTPTPADRTVTRTAEGLHLQQPIEFEPGSTYLSPSARKALDEIADLAVEEPGQMLTIVSHVDRGSWKDPDGLSQAQADALVAYLKSRILPERLVGVGAGAREPIIPNLTSAARNLNRRIEVVLSNGKGLAE